MILPTVRIHHPDDPEVMVTINESDLADHHDLWDDVPSEAPSAEVRVGKGPRGRWYLRRGREIVDGPFQTEIEADLAMRAV